KTVVAAGQAATGNVSGAVNTMVFTPTPQALQPSNKTQADASSATQTTLVVATAAIPIGGTETAFASETTTLFRAVMPAEAQSIDALGVFSNSLGVESKYFSTTLGGAQSYADQATAAFGDGPFSFFSTEIPTSAITPDMQVTVDGGINTIVVSTEDMTKLSVPSPVQDHA